MKGRKLLGIAGSAALALGGIFGALAWLAVQEGRQLDASSKIYVDRYVPAILAEWSAELLIRESSSTLREKTSEHEIHATFERLAALGKLEEYVGSTGSAKISISPASGKAVSASYEVRARCENGDLAVAVTLLREDARWRISGFFVSSPSLAGKTR
ncbi:hypothetical protein [Steroidobacter cummioxidans]|uniref:hypothetical protein n=1 Tax=Steroidobacter cummioxidans TaxID=1803913 RepID=UPI000E3130E8|nr:hypothetical protein [Steroidobacter cummioxidans]